MSQPRKSTVIDWQQRIPTESSPLRANDRPYGLLLLMMIYTDAYVEPPPEKWFFQSGFPSING